MLYQNFQTQAELDAQYDAEQLGLDLASYINFYISNSEIVREQFTCNLDIPFGPNLDEH